jgi:hypothetical protein
VGTVLVADEQGAGKGRGGNVWTSPAGCLLFSFTCQVTDGSTLPFLQYVVALSLVQAIQLQAAHAIGTTFIVCSRSPQRPSSTHHHAALFVTPVRHAECHATKA